MRWSRLWPLEVTLAAAIIASTCALCLDQLAALRDKVRLTEVLTAFSTARSAAAESIALTGRLDAPAAPAPSSWSGMRYRYRETGTGIVASGVLRDDGPAFQLSFNPSISESDLGWSVIWLCGTHPAPAHWVAVAPALADHLSREQLPFVCRDSREP